MSRRVAPRRPDPPPLEADEVRVVAVGTALFTVALVAFLVLREPLTEAGHGWLGWSCVTGIVLGLFGLVYTRRRRDARDARQRRTVPLERDAPQPEPPVSRPHPGSPRPGG